jgi:hypothetical protein
MLKLSLDLFCPLSSIVAAMWSPFKFRTELRWNWDKNKAAGTASMHEVNELYHAYKAQYLRAEKDERNDGKCMVKSFESIITEAKSDWESLTVIKMYREDREDRGKPEINPRSHA